MDKIVIFAVAGSGKTTHIVNSLSRDKRSLIVTYTIANYENLQRKILAKFEGVWPNNVVLMRYFSFLYSFCYKPFLAEDFKARGIIYEDNKNRYIRQTDRLYYITNKGYLYSNRLSLLLEAKQVIDDIQDRVVRYFDEFIVDEVQDIAGRDFNFLEKLMETDVNQLYVGDFYQHTFDTSRDGNVNGTLFDSKAKYEKRFSNKGFYIDNTSLINSWRCSPAICQYITDNLGIEIHSNRHDEENTSISLISEPAQIQQIASNNGIVKLHYQKGASFGYNHYNWGETKGEDQHNDVCVYLNKTTAKAYREGKLSSLKPSTRNKLYVAITRAHGNVYLVNE